MMMMMMCVCMCACVCVKQRSVYWWTLAASLASVPTRTATCSRSPSNISTRCSTATRTWSGRLSRSPSSGWTSPPTTRRSTTSRNRHHRRRRPSTPSTTTRMSPHRRVCRTPSDASLKRPSWTSSPLNAITSGIWCSDNGCCPADHRRSKIPTCEHSTVSCSANMMR